MFTFVDLKDPFVSGEIAGEELPGPVLSMMGAKSFGVLTSFTLRTPTAAPQPLRRRSPSAFLLALAAQQSVSGPSMLMSVRPREPRIVWPNRQVDGINDCTDTGD